MLDSRDLRESSAPQNRAIAIAAAALGNTLEWFDFTVYALFAGPIAENFFPGGDPSSGLLKTFLFFGLGFVVRPLGAALIGNYADRAGRKAALVLTLLLMALGTGIIAFAPTYRSIGLGAPLLLLMGRLLQGLSAGGEVGGATAYLLETGAPGARGRSASWVQASMGVANILGALTAFTVSAVLSTDQVRDWGWRVPFVLGLSIAPVGWYLRRSLEETDAFKIETSPARGPAASQAPLLEVFRHHGSMLAAGFGVAVLWAVAAYVLVIFFPTYIQQTATFGFSGAQAFGASLIANVPFVLACVAFGTLSDRLGRRASLAAGAALLLVAVLPLFRWLEADPSFRTLVVVQCSLCALVAAFAGVAPSALSEIFPTAVRSTGISLVYNAAFTIFGGFAPMILTYVTHRSGGSLFAPAWYVMAAAVIALLSIPFLKPSPAMASE
jgi:MHS family proline/betaine transporter-like MFS transporter